MPKSSLSDKTTRPPKEPFDPALEAPIALTPDQLERSLAASIYGASACRSPTWHDDWRRLAAAIRFMPSLRPMDAPPGFGIDGGLDV